MRVNTDIQRTQRSYLSIDEFKGADLRNGCRNFSRAAFVRNLYSDNGLLRKRKGWTQIRKFDGKINSIIPVRADGQSYTLIYAAKHFYLLSNGEYTDITASGTAPYGVDADRLVDKSICAFYHKEKTYIIGCGDYLVLGTFGGGLELRRVEENIQTYVPTTTICIPPAEGSLYVRDDGLTTESRGIWFVKNASGYSEVIIDGTNTQWSADTVYYKRKAVASISSATLEEPNLLTGYRKNTLYGTSAPTSTYKLDGQPDNDSDTIISVHTVNAQGAELDITLQKGAGTTETRSPEVGDDICGKTINIIAGTETCSTLRQKENNGKRVLWGKGIRALWVPVYGYSDNWNKAELICNYMNTSGHYELIRLAYAERINTLYPYTVQYIEGSITLSSTYRYSISSVDKAAGFENHFHAVLPANVFTLVDENGIDWGTINNLNGTVSFTRAVTPVGDEDNISVLFKARSLLYSAEDICNCSFGCEFGADGNTDRLFFSGNEGLPNYDFHSESDDPTYFPQDGVSVFGTTSSPITGYARFSDDSQVVFKRKGRGDSTIFVRRGGWETNTINVGNSSFKVKKAVFSLTGNYVAEGCVSPFSIGYPDVEPLFLSENGVFSLQTSGDKAGEHRYTVERSATISAELSRVDGSTACSLTCDGRYYLCVGGKLYITGRNGTFVENGRKQYEWWIWDNINATCLAEIEGKLMFGTEDGRLCVFGDRYFDEIFNDTTVGELSFSENSEAVEFSESVPLRTDSVVYLRNDVYSPLFRDCSVLDGKILIPPEAAVVLGEQTVYADNVGESGLCVSIPMDIKNIDVVEGSFELYSGDNRVQPTVGGFDLCINLKNRPLYIVGLRFTLDVSANDVCSFALSRSGEPLCICSYNGSLPQQITAGVYLRRPVAAEWRTPETDFGNDCMLKNIHSVAFALTDDTGGAISLNCHAAGHETVSGLNYPLSTNFAASDFSCFAFNGTETKNCYAKLRHRGLNYAYFAIISEEALPFAMKNLNVEYSYLKKNRGIN